jgi:hypothetical protein
VTIGPGTEIIAGEAVIWVPSADAGRPREKDKLMIAMAAVVARRRLERGSDRCCCSPRSVSPSRSA